MALVNCSECGKEISDKARVCPHCGYKKEGDLVKLVKNQKGNLVKYVKNPKNRMPIFAGGIILAFLLIILVVVHGKMDSPFERITEKTTRKDVIRLFGKGDQIEGSTDDAALFYGKSKFGGLKGTLRFVFFDDGELFGGYWTYRLKDEETFEDYDSQITKIIEYYTDLYGEPRESGDEYTWYDENENEYTLYLVDTKIQRVAYKAIEVSFDPY